MRRVCTASYKINHDHQSKGAQEDREGKNELYLMRIFFWLKSLEGSTHSSK